MADNKHRTEENVAGRYYVDENCIAAKYCLSVARNHFKLGQESGRAFVCKQPTTEEEEEQLKDALSGCPVNAIGDDG